MASYFAQRQLFTHSMHPPTTRSIKDRSLYNQSLSYLEASIETPEPNYLSISLGIMMRVSQPAGRRQTIEAAQSWSWSEHLLRARSCSFSRLQEGDPTGILTLGFNELPFPLQAHYIPTVHHP